MVSYGIKAWCRIAVNDTVSYFCGMASDNPLLNCRVPKDLKDRLEAVAKSCGRSLTQELIMRIERSLTLEPVIGAVTEADTELLRAERLAQWRRASAPSSATAAEPPPTYASRADEVELVDAYRRLAVEKKGLVLAMLKLVA